MRKLSLLLLLAAPVFAVQQGANVTATGAYLTGNHPASGAWTSINSYRIEGRIHNCTVGGIIYWDNDVRVATNCTSSITFTSWRDSAGGQGAETTALPTVPNVCLTGDYQFRAQRTWDAATPSLSLELWCTNNGSYQLHAETQLLANFHNTPITDGPGQFGIGNAAGAFAGCTCNVDYIRHYFSVVPLGTSPSSTNTANAGDWELDGLLTDASSFSQTLTNNGGATFSNSNLYGPVVSFAAADNCFLSVSYSPKFCTVKSGATIPLRTTAYSPNLNDTLTYSWTQISGPQTAVISAGTTANATAAGVTVFGEYDFRVMVTDSELNSANATLDIGMVTPSATNACVLQDMPSDVQYILGPVTPWGYDAKCSPWPYFDAAEIGDAISLASQNTPPAVFTATPKPGTVTITGAGPYSMVGTGTNFTTDCGGSCAGHAVFIDWNAPLVSSPVLPAGPTGRALMVVNVVTDATHASFTGDFGYNPPLASSTGVTYRDLGLWDPNNSPFKDYIIGWGWQGQPSYSWNYYDNVSGLYRIWYRTGIDFFRDEARTLADNWYAYSLQQGYSAVNTPRALLLPGIMVRAVEGQSGYWDGLELKIKPIGNSAPVPYGNFDTRETGYSLSYESLGAKLDPTPASRATYCTYLTNAVTNYFPPEMTTDGALFHDDYVVNSATPRFGPEPSQTWILAINAKAFEDAYTVLHDPTACNNPGAAATSFGMASALLSYIYPYGIAGSRTVPVANGGGVGMAGTWYAVGLEASGASAGSGGNPATDNDWASGDGTVTATAGSHTITGVGTHFTAGWTPASIGAFPNFQLAGGGFAPCNGSTYIAIYGAPTFVNGGSGVGGVHRVTACPSNTSLTIEDTMPQGSFSGSWYQIVQHDVSSSCAPSRTTGCQGGINPDELAVETSIYGWMFAQTSDYRWRVWGDDLFATAFGGPAGGPGSTGLPAGPGASGTTVSAFGYIDVLPACNVSAPPCSGIVGHFGKDFGVGSGYVGASEAYLAYRTMGTPPACQ